MEHTQILAAGAASAPIAPIPLSQDIVDALALHGLRELLFAPIPKLAVALAHLDRDQLGQAIEVMIAMLDAADGDPDAEADDRGGETVAIVEDPDAPPPDEGDDPDLEQTFDEDDWCAHAANGPGCPVSDPGGAGEHEDDELSGDEEDGCSAEDEHGYGNHSVPRWVGPGCVLSDAGEDGGDTELNGDEGDYSDGALVPEYEIDQSEPIPALIVERADRDRMKPHTLRLRETRCNRLPRPNPYTGARFKLRGARSVGLGRGSDLL